MTYRVVYNRASDGRLLGMLQNGMEQAAALDLARRQNDAERGMVDDGLQATIRRVYTVEKESDVWPE